MHIINFGQSHLQVVHPLVSERKRLRKSVVLHLELRDHNLKKFLGVQLHINEQIFNGRPYLTTYGQQFKLIRINI